MIVINSCKGADGAVFTIERSASGIWVCENDLYFWATDDDWRKEGQMDGKPDCGYSGHMLSGEGAHEH